MDGPEHYREAERILAEIASTPAVPEDHWMTVQGLAAAQVHATLAAAAAAAYPMIQDYLGADSQASSYVARQWVQAVVDPETLP